VPFVVYQFGDFSLHCGKFELCRKGRRLKLERKPFELLVLLVTNNGQVVTRNEIARCLWEREVFVDIEHGINTAIRKIRQVLGDSPDLPRFVQTISGSGYRFIALVTAVEPEVTEPTQPSGDPVDLPPAPPQIAATPVIPAATKDLGGTVDSDHTAGGAQKVDARTIPAESSPSPSGQPVPSVLPHESRIPGLPAPDPPIPSSLPPSSPRLSPFSKLLRLSVPIAAIVLIALAAGAIWLSRRGTPHLPATEKRVTSNPPDAPIRGADVSPDGKYVAYTDPTGLYLRHIATGETHPWGVPKDFIAYPNSWFPDGTHLLVTRVEGATMKRSLWKLSLLGGSPRMLMAGGFDGAVSPDGSRIAYVAEPESRELWSMDSDGANPRKIATAKPGGFLWTPAWSPDGQRIAYVESAGSAVIPADLAFTLQTRDAGGADPQVVLRDTRLKPALCWAADGRILFAYREDPTNELLDEGVRSIQVDQRTGKAIGAPQIVAHGQGRIGTLSVSADGKRLVLWRENTQFQSFIAEFEAGSHRLKTPRRLILDANGNMATAWTSDSKSVLFVSNRNGTWKLFRQAIDETTAEVLVEGRSHFLPRLSADGSQALYLSYPEPNATSLPIAVMRVPLAGGPPQLVLQAPDIGNIQCAGPQSRLCIFNQQVGATNVFISFDPEHGIGREITRVDSQNGFNWSLSPDGSLLAMFRDGHTIRFLSLKTGAARDVLVKDWQLNNGDWSADGKSVYMQSFTSTGVPVVLNVSEEGKAEVVLQGAANTGFWCLIQSPDRRQAIVGEVLPGDNNVWMVDNF
jgi:DNA-binding winged helix-turn-helix (wHTH) protein/Tol biopolymer transport system component